MKIVIAPDSFKESMSAASTADAIERGIRNVDRNIDVIKMPLADGGEGTVEALVNSMNGKLITHTVTGPLGGKVKAFYGIVGKKTAVIEIAAAAGLDLIPVEKRDPMKTTTYGVGELILHALDQGIRHFLIGLGGSATNDGGIGMAQALGAQITDKIGDPVRFGGEGLADVEHISVSKMDERVKECTFDIACDVKNPLTGPEGASFIFGPQKGADPNMVASLDQSMKKYEQLLKKDLHVDVSSIEGAGAAGGLGAAFIAFFDAKLQRGIELVMKITNIETYIQEADLVITGEGKIDDQTIYGKTPVGVAKIAKKHGVPVIAITGANLVTSEEIYETGIDAIFSITNAPMSLEESMEKSEWLIEQVVENVMRLVYRTREQGL
ncbi:glycerate kinase family protein [Pseudogracilibacillus sp. SO30301A]|uniref:glycerate kinase family protein n=1 Tax=Pseudogracilibacillus sp. SO30301A TaxID=3098291 RepID=UPI00300DD313